MVVRPGNREQNQVEQNKEVFMSVRIVKLLAVVVSAALLAMPVFAGDDGPGGPGNNRGNGVCTAEGVWVGSMPGGGGPAFTMVFTPGSHRQGSYTLITGEFDASFGGAFPATMMSPFAGTWVKTGPRTADWTMMAYGLGADPSTGVMTPVYIIKSSGYVEFTGQCEELEIMSVSVALYLPTQDPFGDDPPYFGCFPDGTLEIAKPLPAEPPCEPASR
jgi:hypothetical protein